MTINKLLEQLRSAPDTIKFNLVIDIINSHYDYTPTSFSNGDVLNAAGTNEGSCKIFAFAQLQALSEMETLALFGTFYRDDVMGNPTGDDHRNIRNFILDGWLGIKFDQPALKIKRLH